MLLSLITIHSTCSKAMSFLLVICGRVRTAYHKTSRGKGAVMQVRLSNTFNVLDIIVYLL